MTRQEGSEGLPKRRIIAIEPPEPVTKGWWLDPFSDGTVTSQRFHDGTSWTPFVCHLYGRLWSDVLEVPLPGDTDPS